MLVDVIHGWDHLGKIGSCAREKSGRIFEKLDKMLSTSFATQSETLHLENIGQLLCDLPFAILDFVFPHLHIAIAAKFVVSITVDIRKVEHLVSVIPPRCDVPRHHPFGQWFLPFGLTGGGHSVKDCEPLRQDNGC